MKKLALIISLVLSSGLMHAISLTHAGSAINNGDVIHLTQADVDELFGTFDLEGQFTLDNNANTLQVSIVRSDLDMDDNICLSGSACISSNGSTTQTVVSTSPGSGSWSVHATAVDGECHVVEYRFIEGANTVSFTVQYDAKTSSLGNKGAVGKVGVFDIFGKQLRKDNNTDGLPSGIYIVGGKKVVLR